MHKFKVFITQLLAVALLATSLTVVPVSAQTPEKGGQPPAQNTSDAPGLKRFDELADLPFPGGASTAESAQTLKDELLFQRGTQVYIWAMPLIMTRSMQAGSEKAFGSGYNVLPIWKQLTDAKARIITPNTVTMYAVNYLDLGQDGPLVMDLPPNLQGFISDYWGTPIPVDGGQFSGDIGFPGPDKAKGGKFLLLPPGYEEAVPEGYFVYRPATRSVLTTFRAFASNTDELPSATALLEKIRIYPLGREATAKKMVFPNASGVAVNMLPAVDVSAFDQLKLLVDREGDNFAGPDWLGMLASLGIVKGEPFNPDERTRTILDRAAKVGFKTSRALAYQSEVNGINHIMWPGRRWLNPFTARTPEKPGGLFDLTFMNTAGKYRELDVRAAFFSFSWGISPGMLPTTPGVGAVYAVTGVDSTGASLSGDNTYRLSLPPNIPAKKFWNVTLYDAFTGELYDNGQRFPAIGSFEKPVQNADGSTDLYFGPKAPEGKAGNWHPTAPGKAYFVILRLYFPTQEAIDRTWKPGDFEKVKQ